jgi:hypothetical protein
MTQSQKQIIDSIKLEFEKINNTKSYGGNLIDIDGILGDIAKDDALKEEIRINNEYQDRVLDEMILNDVYLLNKDLNKIGLYAFKGKYHDLSIGIIGWDYSYLNISYDMALTYKTLKSETTMPFKEGFNYISSYTKSDGYKTKYENIKDITSSSEFKSKIRYIYEKSLKN